MFMKAVLAFLVLISASCSLADVTCLFNDTVYPIGHITQVDPCDQCYCHDSGLASCIRWECFYGMMAVYCPDGSLPVYHPKECCPTCPETVPSITNPG